MLATRQLYKNGTAPIADGDATHVTNDYDKFNPDGSNRPKDPAHVARLVEAIKKKNLLREYPIVVDSRMTVLDGQHRLAAATELGVPIFYVVSKVATIADIADTNAAQKRWGLEDYINYHCAHGAMEYLTLRRFAERYPFISATTAARLCSSTAGAPRFLRMLKNGEYLADNIPFAKRVADACLDFSAGGFKDYGTTLFVRTVSNLLSNIEYDHERMVKKLSYQGGKLIKCADTEQYMSLLNEIYNYKTAFENRVLLTYLDYRDPRHRLSRNK